MTRPLDFSYWLSAADECARALLTFVGDRPPISVDALASAQGARLQRTDRMTPRARLTTFGSLLIEYKATEHNEVCRRSICHEVAHTFFTSLGRFRVPSTQGLTEPDEEALCDRLALRLLIPERQFLRHLSSREPKWQSVRDIATLFEVTPAMVLTRLNQLSTSPWSVLLVHWRSVKRRGIPNDFRVTQRVAVGPHTARRFFQRHPVEVDSHQCTLLLVD